MVDGWNGMGMGMGDGVGWVGGWMGEFLLADWLVGCLSVRHCLSGRLDGCSVARMSGCSPVCLPVCMSVCMYVCLPVYMSTSLCLCLAVCLVVSHVASVVVWCGGVGSLQSVISHVWGYLMWHPTPTLPQPFSF